MSRLLIVNIEQSAQTERFWKKNKEFIFSRLPDCDLYFPRKNEKFPTFDEYQSLVLIGDDSFFSRVINLVFPLLSELKSPPPFAFIPDSDQSAFAAGLAIPTQLAPNLEIIRSQSEISLDLVRCHYINLQEQPESILILNDLLVGIPPFEKFQTRSLLAYWAKQKLLKPAYYKRRHLMIHNEDTELFEGNYMIGMMLLGNQITNGPKLRTQLRVTSHQFDYFQLNTMSAGKLKTALSNMFQERLNRSNLLMYQKEKFLEFSASELDNYLMADGRIIGRVPAQITHLPRAVQIVSPITNIKKTVPWKSKVLSSKTGLTGIPG